MILAFLRPRIWPFRWQLAVCLVLMLAESLAVLVMPWLAGRIAEDILGRPGLPFGWLAGGLIGLLALQAGLRILQARVLQRTSERLTASLRIDLYDHVQRLPQPWLDDRRRGDLLSLLTYEVDDLADFVTSVLLGILPQLLVLAGAVVVMLRLDPVLAVPVVLGVPAFFVTVKLIGRHIRPLAGQIRDSYSETVSMVEENLTVLPAIKSYAREDLETGRLRAHVAHYLGLVDRMIRHQSLLGPLVQFLAASAIVLILWLAGRQVSEGTMSAGELVAFLLYAGLLTRPVAGLAEVWGEYQHARGALEHMGRVLAIPPEVPGGLIPQTVRGAIRFDDLRFRYPGRPPLLSGVTIAIEAGETVAITGVNGAGKTTLIELVMRIRQPDGGRILLDDNDVADLDLPTLRRQIALVPQREALVDGTIADNILFGRPDATRAEVETAAREAEAADFIAALPQGLDTRIGEGGVRLSGGQRQRIALARALLKKPAVLILDEPTAMFDPAAEARFVETARSALAGRTVILITHRPASLVLADRVLRLDDGILSEVPAPEGPARG